MFGKKKESREKFPKNKKGRGKKNVNPIPDEKEMDSIPQPSVEDAFRNTSASVYKDEDIPIEDILIKDEEAERWKAMSKSEKKAFKKQRKKQKRKDFFDRFNWSLLREEIESYGYHYSFGAIMKQMAKYFVGVGVISYVLQLDIVYILILGIVVFLAIPIIVRAQYEQMYEIRRFQMVTSYLDNIIPIFKNHPVIPDAWAQVLDLVDGEMHTAIQEALDYIQNNFTDEYPYETACAMIEKHFPNSRIHSVHKMMLTVVRQNSTRYHEAVDNVFYDVSSWISRTFGFQKDLEDKKQKLLLLSLVTLGADCLFIAAYSTNEIFKDFPKMTGYQVSTFIFVLVLLLLMIAFFVKMNGKWLVDDMTSSITKKYEKAFNYMISHEDKQTATNQQKAMSVLMVLLGVVAYISQQNIVFLVIFAVLAYFIYTSNGRTYRLNRKKVEKSIEMEFPVWLRDVALNLNNMTVLNAVENSRTMSSPILNYYVERFLRRAMEDPSSIRPYNDFLEEYSLPDIKTTMKALYTMQDLDEDQKSQQTNSLIVRNQEMLAKAEKMRNDDSVSGITKFGFLPVAIFMVQMMVSMILMFMFMMNYMGEAMSGIGM